MPGDDFAGLHVDHPQKPVVAEAQQVAAVWREPEEGVEIGIKTGMAGPSMHHFPGLSAADREVFKQVGNRVTPMKRNGTAVPACGSGSGFAVFIPRIIAALPPHGGDGL
jgi:hypothetical protein